jgi:predicted signal transduction protein with EAL and GGDEF domain
MSVSDILQWFSTFVIAVVLAYLAFRKAPVERQSYDASAAAQYAMAAKTKSEENDRLQSEIDELRQLFTRKKYRVTLEFTIGDPPEPGKVIIEPIIDPPLPITRPIQKRRQ